MLQGYEVEIRNETHRANLLRDARYFHLKGLEQRLVACEKTYNLNRQQNEILMRLEDIRQSGVGFAPDPAAGADPGLTAGSVSYARPYTDDATATYILILETSTTESTTLHLPPSPPRLPHLLTAHAAFHADTRRRMTSLFNIVASKMNLPPTHPLSLTHTQPRVKVRIDSACALTVDGKEVELGTDNEQFPPNTNRGSAALEWVVRRAQWRVRVEAAGDEEAELHVVLEAVRIDATTKERARNATRGFLGGA